MLFVGVSWAAVIGGAVAPGHLRVYFDTDDIDATRAKIQELGGQADDKMPVQGYGWFWRLAATPRGTRSACGSRTSRPASRHFRLGPDDRGKVQLPDDVATGGASRRCRSRCRRSARSSRVERRINRRGYVSRRSRTRSALPSLRGTLPGGPSRTRAVSPSAF